MGKSWTEEQRQVINLRNRSLLVSAAAGSGKTAVLVERIIQKITDSTRPMDIDRLLVVTFTKAAAAEMRERVMAAVDARLLDDPENTHLQKQKMLLPSAMITTIDSFCMSVLRSILIKSARPGFYVATCRKWLY
ncbi:UvrD-helicase domain-containing protein [Frisingicoccus sp.]|uniref:UvrD-helicase domain-containing protein n=1 Tax=Frisingicoccus sp. TaxID=1918627 RepID=UPI003993634D